MWRKSWLECRFRVLLSGLVTVLVNASFLLLSSAPVKGKAVSWEEFTQLSVCTVVAFIAVMMAGSGINSQTSWGILQGFHPSMYFLLSLPVSRRRAFFVRNGLGALCTLGFIIVTVAATGLSPRPAGFGVTLQQVCVSIFYMSISSIAIYALSTLMTTIFDEFWAGMISLMIVGFCFGLGLALFELGKHFTLVEFMAGTAFARTGNPHWLAIAAFLAFGIAIEAVSIWIVERKEY